MASLDECAKIGNKNEFVEAVIEIIKPFVELALEKPELFVPAEGRDREFIKINELLSYGVSASGNQIHIHIVPDEAIRNGFSRLINEGLRELAKVVKENEQIKSINGTSWIIAKQPRILEKLGFTLDGEISEEVRAKHFPGEKMEIHEAHMSREDFLDKYLEK